VERVWGWCKKETDPQLANRLHNEIRIYEQAGDLALISFH